MADPGHFLTDSGSKIPLPKSKDEGTLRVPQKPNLTATKIEKTNYMDQPEPKPATSSLARSRNAIGRSNPAISKNLCRSKTNLMRPLAAANSARVVSTTTQVAVKRHASVDDIGDTKSAKIPRTGFPYKAKTWELKLRLAECEQWLTDARLRSTELEVAIDSNASELEDLRNVRQQFEKEKIRADNFQELFNEKTQAYDKLHADSKQFLDKIQTLELEVAKKKNEQDILQADLTNLRAESLANASEMSKLRFSLEDLEFKFKRQKNTLDDLENSYNDSKRECSMLQSKVRERDLLISETQERFEKSERENKSKANIINDLEDELAKARTKINELERNLSSTQGTNNNLSTEVAGLKDDLLNSQNKVTELSENVEEMRSKLCDSEKFRRYLHNQVQDLKGNIRVFCRVRPPLSSEKENCLMCNINYPDEGTIEVAKSDPFENSGNVPIASRPKFQKHEYSFDRVFNPSATQELVFEELSQLVQSALDGYNVCIFAYGQTGSGKTYTMEGPNVPEGRGMIPRTVQHIFKTVGQLEMIGWQYTVEVCFIEIYNEIIRDLLRSDKDGTNLKIMQVDTKTNDVVIPGLTVMKVESYDDLDRLYVLAHQNRAVAATSCNERSSRSHSVTKIKVTGVHKERGETCYGSLNLVDLAGSERLSETTAANDPRLREMKNINKSLSELGNVILGLYQKNEHIPYRNSKLTHLLQPALGGSSKTLMLVNISPVESCMSETLCSLRFAQKVNQVKVASSKKRITYDANAAK